jgi:hypothetical protein
MHDILKQLNDRNPSDVRALDERGLRRLEVLCEAWAQNRRGGTRATQIAADRSTHSELTALKPRSIFVSHVAFAMREFFLQPLITQSTS